MFKADVLPLTAWQRAPFVSTTFHAATTAAAAVAFGVFGVVSKLIMALCTRNSIQLRWTRSNVTGQYTIVHECPYIYLYKDGFVYLCIYVYIWWRKEKSK